MVATLDRHENWCHWGGELPRGKDPARSLLDGKLEQGRPAVKGPGGAGEGGYNHIVCSPSPSVDASLSVSHYHRGDSLEREGNVGHHCDQIIDCYSRSKGGVLTSPTKGFVRCCLEHPTSKSAAKEHGCQRRMGMSESLTSPTSCFISVHFFHWSQTQGCPHSLSQPNHFERPVVVRYRNLRQPTRLLSHVTSLSTIATSNRPTAEGGCIASTANQHPDVSLTDLTKPLCIWCRLCSAIYPATDGWTVRQLRQFIGTYR